jgi:metallophosphoesterase (TIGR00282 family)
VFRILFLGDIVGKPGENLVVKAIPHLRQKFALDFVIANAENAEDGSGLKANVYKRLIKAGIDVITLGDHVYRKKEIISILEVKNDIVRPANLSPEAPGKRWTVVQSISGVKVAVCLLLGRVFMRPVDCPFHTVDRILTEIPDDVKVRMIDMHAEATSDKQLMGRYLDGRVSAVLGTHTHVATADEQVLPGGTAFQCDVGMSGPHLSILGRKIEPVLQATLTDRPFAFHVASDDVRLNGAIIEVDPETGRALSIERFQLTEKQAAAFEPETQNNTLSSNS